MSYSEEAGVHLVSDMACRNFYCSGHCEYDSDTLAREYFRDLKKGLDIKMPHNYFPDNDIKKRPLTPGAVRQACFSKIGLTTLSIKNAL